MKAGRALGCLLQPKAVGRGEGLFHQAHPQRGQAGRGPLALAVSCKPRRGPRARCLPVVSCLPFH